MGEMKQKKFGRQLSIWLFLLLFLLFFLYGIQGREKVVYLTYTEFRSHLLAGEISRCEFYENKLVGTLVPKDGKAPLRFVMPLSEIYASEVWKRVESYNETVPKEKQVDIVIPLRPFWQNWGHILSFLFPMLVILLFYIFLMRQVQAGSKSAMSFGKSRARLIGEGYPKVTFDDVAGADEAKEELKEVVEFLRDPQKFQRLGGRIPKGVILVGPPGTGKTLLARAVAGEANVPFFSISGSDFVEMFVGVGASRVRDLFDQAKKNAPCIIFIDEIDAVGRQRGAGLGGGHDEREQTLNQLLVEMDGFDTKEGVILIAATNRPDVLDPALLRPGRFDRHVVVDLPDLKGREGILKVHTRKIPLADDVDLSVIARGTPYFSGADLANLVNEAALLAARKNKKKVDMSDFEEARDKVMMGPERKSRVISEKEKRLTAAHEAGHALVTKLLPGTDPIHKVTIIPRGLALGITQRLPLEDRHTRSKTEILNDITIAMGGRVAEELMFNEITSGATMDLKQATELARKMVCEWGMSEKLGPMTFGHREEHIFLGREITRTKDYSEQTAIAIDNEVRDIIDQCYKKAKELLSNNMDKLLAMTEALLDREVLSREDIEKIMRGEKLAPLKQTVYKHDVKKETSPAETTDNVPQTTPISTPTPKVLPA